LARPFWVIPHTGFHALPGKLFHNNVDHLLNKLVEFIRMTSPGSTPMPGVATRSIRRRSGRDAGRTADYDGWQRNVGLRDFTSHVKPAAHFVRLYGEKNIMHVDYVSRTVTLEPGATLPSAIGRWAPAFGQAMQFLRRWAKWNGIRAWGISSFLGTQSVDFDVLRFHSDGAPLPIPTRDICGCLRGWIGSLWESAPSGGDDERRYWSLGQRDLGRLTGRRLLAHGEHNCASRFGRAHDVSACGGCG